MAEGEGEFMDRYLGASVEAMSAFAKDAGCRATLLAMAGLAAAALRGGHKILLAGNGGSAADAQHIACEFVGRFLSERSPLAAIALTTDSSILTAVGNDYGYDAVFERQVLALANPGDVFVGLSTSGNSANVLRALRAARRRGAAALGFTGAAESAMTPLCDALLRVPSRWTPIVQQLHLTAAHILCGLVEQSLAAD